jgi:hypothetical protein
MSGAREWVASARRARVLAALLALGALEACVHQKAPPATPAAAPAPVGSAPSASAEPGATPPSAAPSPTPRATADATGHAPAPKRPAPLPAAPGTAPGPASAPSRAGPVLNLASLEQRLRDTHAIGVFTKLSLKNQVDDLLAQFRAFYAGQGEHTLVELRHSYELLLMKVVTLLQDADPGLAGAVSSSREAIWSILSDRNRFDKL